MDWKIMLAAFGCCVFTALLGYELYKTGRRLKAERLDKSLYETLEDSFRSRQSQYERLDKWLKSIGAEYAVKGFGDPFRFVMINALVVVVVLTVVSMISGFPDALVVSVSLVCVEILILMMIDQKQNKEMLDDVSFLYDATAIQLGSNIYVVQAVSNCLVYIKSRRLKNALTELCRNLALGGDVRAATGDFREKFNNTYLDAFCNVVVQITTETGEAGKLIEDMSRQLSVLKETSFMEKKKSTENKLQLCIIGIFIVFTVLIFYLCLASMTGSTGMLF